MKKMSSIILGSFFIFAACSPCNKSDNELKYNESIIYNTEVEIIEGFFIGQRGKTVSRAVYTDNGIDYPGFVVALNETKQLVHFKQNSIKIVYSISEHQKTKIKQHSKLNKDNCISACIRDEELQGYVAECIESCRGIKK